MREQIRQKWRPSLALVVACTVLAILSLPMMGMLILRYSAPVFGWGPSVVGIAFGVALMAGLIGFVLWRVLLRPVATLANRAEAIKRSEAGALIPLKHYGTAELRSLGQAMLDMGATLQNREAGIRAYSDHVTHEMKSPLTSLIAAAELLAGPVDAEDHARLVASIRSASTRMEEQLNALRRLAVAREPLGRGPTKLSAAVSALALRTPLEVIGEGEGNIPVNHDGLLAVLEQLAQNSVAHDAKSLTLRYCGNSITVRDDGAGICEGDRSRIFAPFFTTRRDSGGTGLGLSIVRNMLEATGTQIVLVPSDTGTVFEISF